MTWSAADIPDQSGRTAVVTGANGGLGLETARELARKGAHVVMAVRNQQKAKDAVSDICASVPEASLELVALDLGSQASVREAAGLILREHAHVDLLVNNAGVMGIPERKTVDGYEMQFGVDHLGHWTLTALLLPALLASPGARIVTVTSTAHHIGRAVDPANPHLEGRYRPWLAYGQAKLANFHFGLGLQRALTRAVGPRVAPGRVFGLAVRRPLRTACVAWPSAADTVTRSEAAVGHGLQDLDRCGTAVRQRVRSVLADLLARDRAAERGTR